MTAGEAVEAIEDIASRFAALDDDMRLSITARVDDVLYEVKDGDLIRLDEPPETVTPPEVPA